MISQNIPAQRAMARVRLNSMNAFTKVLRKAGNAVADALPQIGSVKVDNANNPNSAAYKLSQSFGKQSPYDPALKKSFKSTLPSKQKTFGVPNAK